MPTTSTSTTSSPTAEPAPAFRLEVRDIRKGFGGVEVLHGVDLVAAGGSVLALLGENGAGKSTLVKIIAGDYQPDAGAVGRRGRVVRRARSGHGARGSACG